MSRDWYSDVRDFHLAADHPVLTVPTPLPSARAELRKKLLTEEVEEFCEAVDASDIVETADAIADILYVAIGAAIEAGIDLHAVWDEVQRTNMAKTHGPKRPDGKTMKPPGWTPPDIAGILARQGVLRA